jgi:hypothetical protein
MPIPEPDIRSRKVVHGHKVEVAVAIYVQQ